MMPGCHHTAETRAKISAAITGTKNHNYGKPRSEETRAKISAAHMGKIHSIESRAKMSIAKHNMSNETRARMSMAKRGKPLSDEAIAASVIANRGRPLSTEHRAKISASLTGKKLSEEARAKLSAVHMGKNRGKRHSMEARAKMSAARKGWSPSEETRAKMSAISKRRAGKSAHNWRGGISFEPYCPKFNDDLKQRVREFFENQCVMCGNPNTVGRNLCCHHVTYNKEMCCDGKPVRFAALCHSCHAKTNGGDRQRWEDMLHRAIEEIWDGKSYFTKEEYAEMKQ